MMMSWSDLIFQELHLQEHIAKTITFTGLMFGFHCMRNLKFHDLNLSINFSHKSPGLVSFPPGLTSWGISVSIHLVQLQNAHQDETRHHKGGMDGSLCVQLALVGVDGIIDNLFHSTLTKQNTCPIGTQLFKEACSKRHLLNRNPIVERMLQQKISPLLCLIIYNKPVFLGKKI